MSRRRGFDTALTDSDPKPKAPTPSTHNHPKRTGPPSSAGPSTKKSLPPRVTPPDPEHAAVHVPTEETSPTDQPVTEEAVPAKQGEAAEAGFDDDVCFICAEPATYWSRGVCGHKTCQYVSLRDLHIGQLSSSTGPV